VPISGKPALVCEGEYEEGSGIAVAAEDSSPLSVESSPLYSMLLMGMDPDIVVLYAGR